MQNFARGELYVILTWSNIISSLLPHGNVRKDVYKFFFFGIVKKKNGSQRKKYMLGENVE